MFLRFLSISPKLYVANNRTMSVFTKKVNPVTGKGEWIFHDENYDFHQEIARSAFADMLHDTERNQKYYEGIKLAVQKMHRQGKKANVLDIGTGTGLLAMMAASCGADSVVACEAFIPMAHCAKRVLNENNLSDKIKLIMKRSTDITVGAKGDMENRANILVTEVFDTELIGEGALGTFIHAHEHLLEKDCIVVPSLAIIYAQVVESDFANGWNKLSDWFENGVSIQTPKRHATCPGAAAVHDIQLSQFSQKEFTTIVAPTRVLSFDWSGQTQLHATRSTKVEVKAEVSGTAQMVFMWWELLMDDEGTVKLTCAPAWAHPDGVKQPWRDHWMQAVYYLPKELTVTNGETLTLYTSHDEFSLWFDLLPSADTIRHETNSLRPICDCGLHVMASRTRIGCMNDKSRRRKFMSALKSADIVNKICLCLSDGSLLGPVAASLGARHVYCVETYNLARQFLHDYCISNNLEDRVTIVASPEDLLKVEGLAKQVTIVFGEPAFFSSILPWHNIYFWYLKNELNQLIADTANIIPCQASIWGMAIEFDHLWKIRSPLHTVEGFSMIKFDELIDASRNISDSQIEAHPLWEYPGRPITCPFHVTKFDFGQKSFTDNIEKSGQINCEWSGTCHGIALWVDWHLDAQEENVISTGPVCVPKPGEQVSWDIHTRQGIYFMPVHRTVKKTDVLFYKLNFYSKSGEMIFDFQIMSEK
ncbi:protein arginine N-methyltransferase 7-like isoform X1 [Schistocerca nitens]|uniref:protein arginine N-methyltransferase 7-like isoform X1 n=2 Tax=Schistocerca nitens TaxID=7011 RepID=UPI002117C8A0|nr:protein arginine N-methyltransferase 7-like isoform X1 [Schistocerca nitens]